MNTPAATSPPAHSATPLAQEAAGQRLLAIVTELCAELFPGSRVGVTLESDLTRDIGLDSLGRVELFSRLQSSFGVALPEELLTEARTLGDLLRGVSNAPAAVAEWGAQAAPSAPREDVGSAAVSPAPVTTLIELLEWRARIHPDRVHLQFVDGDGREQPLTYRELLDGARAVAGGLRARGLEPGQAVALMLPTALEYFLAFFGILLAGGICVPLYPPASRAQLQDHMRRQRRILANCEAPLLITIPEARTVAHLLKAQVPTLRQVVSSGELRVEGARLQQPIRRSSDTALLQYTSGSTGAPKGVVLTHAMLLTNIRVMGEAIGACAEDVFVSWLPLYHDMGLIGAWLGSLYYACTLVVMSPLTFLAQPSRWLWSIHRYRGTLSAAPNFGYALCVQKVLDAEIEGLDLSHWRLAFNGAEPIRADTLRAFADRFRGYGLRDTALAPVYGMAEVGLGLAFTPPGRGVLIDYVARAAFDHQGRADPVAAEDPAARPQVSSGRMLPGYRLRVVDAVGTVLGERRQGRLQLQGPSCTTGYYRNPEATRQLFDGEWLDSGDLGYQADGEVFVTGRAKELIIRAGRNLYPYVLEETIGALPGVRAGRVAVFGCPDQALGTERLIVVAETRELEAGVLEQLRQRVNEAVIEATEGPADEVVLAPPGTVLKTSSGKIRRAALRERYASGDLARAVRPLWAQLTVLTLHSLPGLLRRSAVRAMGLAWACYVWALAVPLGLLAWLLTLIIPGTARRQFLVRALARALARLSAVQLQVSGAPRLPERCVIVANHASYLDGIVLTAALPAGVRFVAKRELAAIPVLGAMLRRIGTAFVERFDLRESAQDADKLVIEVGRGMPLVYFAEGTFQRAPGLLPLRMGAFAAATNAAVPVVPIGVRGTRTLLPDRAWLPRRTAIHVQIGESVAPDGQNWSAAIGLRSRVRSSLLELSKEADLELN